MSKLNRYLFLKKMYPEYVVFVKSKNKLITYDMDLKIIKLKKFNNFFDLNVNYIILDGLDIIIKKEYLDNNYFYYFKICLLKEVLDIILASGNFKHIK